MATSLFPSQWAEGYSKGYTEGQEKLKEQLAAKDAEIERLKEVLGECREYFDNRSDIEGDSEHLRPNEEMFLLTRIDEVL